MDHRFTLGQFINILKGHSKYSHNREFMHQFLVDQEKDAKFAKRHGIY